MKNESKQWSELYGKENEPSTKQIQEFVTIHLWNDLAVYFSDMKKLMSLRVKK